MRDIGWRMGFTVTALLLLALVGPGIGCGAGNQIVERLLRHTPQAKVEQFLSALAQGNRPAALALWWPDEMPNEALEARRTAMIDELLTFGDGLDYEILDVEWWRTCCEPAIIDDPNQAGVARFRVAIRSAHKPPAMYLFDVLVPGGYWGDAAGNPLRTWVLVDAYPEGQAPLAWPWR